MHRGIDGRGRYKPPESISCVAQEKRGEGRERVLRKIERETSKRKGVGEGWEGGNNYKPCNDGWKYTKVLGRQRSVTMETAAA